MTKQYGFVVDVSRCTGCRTCAVACKDAHNLPVGLNLRRVLEEASGSWRQDRMTGAWHQDVRAWYVSIACNHCENPACVKVCPTKAHYKRAEDGLVVIDRDKCIGCGMCAQACPKRGMALTALAGPVSNVVLAYVAVVILNFLFFWLDNFGGGWLLMGLMQFFIYVEIISAGLAVFNVFPIPPLDGSKVLFALLSDRAYDKLMRYERYGMGLLMLLLITGLIDTPLGAMRDGLLQLLNNLGTWGYTLPSMLF